MKKIFLICTAIIAVILWESCDNRTRYVDPNTGKALHLEKDPETGLMVNKETGKPVDIYVDTEKKDTIDGHTGKVINGKVRKKSNGVFVYAESNAGDDDERKVKRTEDEYKVKDGDYKKEVEKDGDVTIKDGNKKTKIDGETGERKVKKDD